MNAKKAKTLRRIAEDGSVGQPAVQRVRILAKASNPLDVLDPPKHRIEHADRSTRGLYRLMKTMMKRKDRNV